jgi:hypothetical protein
VHAAGELLATKASKKLSAGITAEEWSEKWLRRISRSLKGAKPAVSLPSHPTLPSEETRQLLDNIKTEIGAGMVLFPKSEADHAHNNACQRANAIIANYAEGNGLFQMTRHLPSSPEESRKTSR